MPATHLEEVAASGSGDFALALGVVVVGVVIVGVIVGVLGSVLGGALLLLLLLLRLCGDACVVVAALVDVSDA